MGVTQIICGGQPDHEHNDDWVYIETFEGSFYRGPEDGVRKEISDNGERKHTRPYDNKESHE